MTTGKTLWLGTLLLAAFGFTFAGSRPAQAATLSWRAVDHAVNESDSSTILWDRSDGAATVWTLSADGQSYTQSAVFGPYLDSTHGNWSAVDVVGMTNGNATPEILWDRADGAMTVTTLTANGQADTASAVFGPFAGGTARSLGVDESGLTHILWTNVNGQMILWTLSADGQSYTAGALFGPYSGWSASDLSVQPDGTAEVLWNNINGEATVWTVSPNEQSFTTSAVFGPFPGWNAKSVSVADAINQDVTLTPTINLLWDRSDGAASVWTLSPDGQSFTAGPVFGPYSGWSGVDVSRQTDGTTQLLWTNVNGMMVVYTLSTDGTTYTLSKTFGPFFTVTSG